MKLPEKTVLTKPGRWICLIILHVWEALEYASGSKYARILNMALLYMQGLYGVLNFPEYGSICLNNAWICLDMPWCPSIWLTMAEYWWMLLNMLENALANCSDYPRVLNRPHHLIFHRVLNMPYVLNMPRFWICRNIVTITLLL